MAAGHGWVDLLPSGSGMTFGANQDWATTIATGGSVDTVALTGHGQSHALRINSGTSAWSSVRIRNTRFRAWNVELLVKWRAVESYGAYFQAHVRTSPFLGTASANMRHSCYYYIPNAPSYTNLQTWGAPSNGSFSGNTNMPHTTSHLVWMWTRLLVVNDLFSAKHWRDDSPEPSGWQRQTIIPHAYQYGPDTVNGTDTGDNTHVGFTIQPIGNSEISRVELSRIYARDLDRQPATLDGM